MKQAQSPIISPKSNQYTNPNEQVVTFQQPQFPSQRPLHLKKTFSQYNPHNSHRSSTNSQNLHTKIPKVILDQIASKTRQQNMNRIRDSKDLKNKQASLTHKNRFSLHSSRNRNSNLFDQESDCNVVEERPNGIIRKSITSMKLPFMEEILSSRNKATCPICLVEGRKKQFVTIANDQCDHLFCRSCMHQYVIFKIKMFEKVTCPDEGCDIALKTTSQIYAQLPLDTREKFKKIAQYNEVLATKTKRICPNQSCSGILDISNPLVNPRCPQCRKVYCKKCYFPNHAGDCDPYQLNFFSQTLNYRQCAKCMNMIEKNEGCNHMTCRCGYQFCYLCGERWKSTHNCEGIGEEPWVRDTWECLCCDCEECDICEPLDYLCECFCFDDWTICEFRPVRFISKLLICILLLVFGLPIWVLYMVVSFGMRLLMGIVMGLCIIPFTILCQSQYENGAWIVLALVFFPVTLVGLIFYGIKMVFDEETSDLADQLMLPCVVFGEIIQL